MQRKPEAIGQMTIESPFAIRRHFLNRVLGRFGILVVKVKPIPEGKMILRAVIEGVGTDWTEQVEP